MAGLLQTASQLSGCSLHADNQFGPRVATSCRAFDFTLLFEDGFFVALPAAVFLLLLPLRLRALRRAPVKVSSYWLATWKLSLLSALFLLHLLFLVFRLQSSHLHTTLAISAAVLNLVSILAAGLNSFMEDQRALNPSDLLVLYFSVSTVLFVPRLRSLWLIASDPIPKALWTVIFVLTAATVIIESAHKTKILRPAYKHATLEQTTGFWGKSLYLWVLPLFQAGYSKVLNVDDIPSLDPVLRENAAWTDLDATWRRTSSGRYRLLRATFKANSSHIMLVILPRLALTGFTFCQPFLVGSSVSYLTAGLDSKSEASTYGSALIGAFLLVYIGIAISRALYWRQTWRMIARVRSGLTSKLYRHATTLRACDVKESTAVTLMGTDVERIVDALSQLHELWASVVEVSIAIWLLARQLSFAAFVPLVVCVASVLGASQVASRFGSAQKAWNQCVEKRIVVTISMLSDMKAVKMLGLTGVLANIITHLRVVELKTSEKFRILRIWRILISNAPTTLAPFLTFATYAGIAAARNDQALLSAQAFTSLSLISILTNPLLTFCQALPTFFQAVSCFERIEVYLLKSTERENLSPSSSVSLEVPRESTEMSSMQQPSAPSTALISFADADMSWSADATAPTLRQLNLIFRRGLTAITGPVASGKSTLLASMIGETTLINGSVSPPSLTGVAFCTQTPWIMNRSIRENITGGLTFDQKWYDYSLMCCELQEEISRMPAGDRSVAGSNGSSLSGGQRQRVALARAVYSKFPIVILDDVISGLDNKTASNIVTRLFGRQGHFRKAGISVIIATHSKRILPHMDTVVVLQNGGVAGSGTYEDIRLQMGHILGEMELASDSEVESTEVHNSDSETATPSIAEEPCSEGAETDIASDPQRRYGGWPVYMYYFKSAKPLALLLWALFTLIGGFTAAFTTIWIDMWTDANEKHPNERLGLYLGIYGMLVVASTLGVAGECWLFFINIITQTSLKMHADLLKAVISAPYSIFQKSDAGSITNRFSQDMDLIDMRLPANAIQFTTGATTCIIQLIILCVMGRYLAAVIPILGATLFLVQRYYLRLSKQVRLLDIEAKAPLYKQFVETEKGVATIRAFRWTTVFHEQHGEILDRAQRPFYMLFCIQQWLELVLDLIVGALAVIIVAVATSVAHSLSPGALGVALVLVLQFNSALTQTIQSWTRLETSIGAVFRVQQFMQDTPEEDAAKQVSAPVSPTWPPRGGVSFRNVVAHYDPEKPPALANVSFSVAPGEKLALCGSSGSGKTTLILATLGMIELSGGQINIDDMDLSTLAGEDVRSHLNIVPQEPFFMPGTVRLNLDPHQRSTDNEIEVAIRAVGLWDKICALSSLEVASTGLDEDITADEWSQGEKQLLCLARALLIPSKVVILDEATSSVDEGTEAIMQEVIDKKFADRTVISVVHRFTYIDRFDKVAVMKYGELVEYDTPQELLSKDSAFKELYRAQHGA